MILFEVKPDSAGDLDIRIAGSVDECRRYQVITPDTA